ncbi:MULTISPECIES: G-D-S-L family lipolytic protein [Nonlabens]|uniref:G-D-S-L family lipolytic protein n=1 Tax=Nonlabens TaxID=363408 RepID=UPI0014288E12|nr:G-D-S-L family lipolytic protein [Nonlabens sp. SY33080]
MKRINIKNISLLAAAALALTACEPELDNAIEEGGVYTAGDADFSKLVTVGNSLTAGFADGALYLDGQTYSYPNILAGQMQFVGGNEFNQPLVNDNLGGLLLNGTQITNNRFVLTSNMGTPVGPAPLAGTPTTDIANKVTGPLNNFGVPGAKSYHLGAPGYGSLAGVPAGTANPYYARFSSSESSTVIGDAIAADGSFFVLWIGNNDILGYATNGGDGEDHNETGNIDPSTYGGNDITNNNVFAGVYQQLVQGLTANGAQGALVNIPDVTSIPFFTTVPYNAIPLDAQTAAFVNQNYAQYNGAMAAYAQTPLLSQEEATARTISFAQGQNAIVILDEDLTDLPDPTQPGQFLPKLRQATPNDLVVFTASSVLGTLADPSNPASVIGVGVPAGDNLVLTENEQQRISTAQASYNATIEALAQANGLAYVDARAVLADVANGGVAFNGGLLSSTYASGGAFSLDAVHPTARGYAYTANTIIQAINEQYGSTIPTVDIGNYPSVTASDNVN